MTSMTKPVDTRPAAGHTFGHTWADMTKRGSEGVDIKTYNADWLLDQWVRWTSWHPLAQALHPLAGLVARGGGLGAPLINDDEALMVDAIVGELLHKHHEAGEAVVHFYRCRRNYSAVAKIMEISRRKATGLVEVGVAFVDGRIDGCRGLDRVRKIYGCYDRPPAADEADQLTVMREKLEAHLAKASGM